MFAYYKLLRSLESKCEEDVAAKRNEAKDEEHNEDTEEVLDLLLSCFLGVGAPSIVIRPCDVVPCEVEREERGEYSEAHDEPPIIIATE